MKRLLSCLIPLILIASLLPGCQARPDAKTYTAPPIVVPATRAGEGSTAAPAPYGESEARPTEIRPDIPESVRPTEPPASVQTEYPVDVPSRSETAPPEPSSEPSQPATERMTEPATEPSAESIPATEPATEPVLPPATEPAPQPVRPPEPQAGAENLADRYTREDWQRMNTFLSNFSEVFFLEYDVFSEGMSCREALQDRFELLQYGYLHYKINDRTKVGTSGNYYTVSKPDMDHCLTRFFGSTIPGGSQSRTYAGQYYDITETVEFRNNTYWFQAADGESYNQFTVADRVYRSLAGGDYVVYFTVYAMDLTTYWEQGFSSSFYRMTSSEAASDRRLEYRYSGYAVVRDYQSGTYRSYQLVDYMIFRDY